MDKGIIRNTAKDVVETLTPVEDDAEEVDEDMDAELSVKAFQMMYEAAKRWRAKHGPSEHCNIQVTRDDNDALTVTVTPVGDADGK